MGSVSATNIEYRSNNHRIPTYATDTFVALFRIIFAVVVVRSTPFKPKKSMYINNEEICRHTSIPCRLDGKQIFPIFLFNKFIKSNSVWYDFLNLTLLYTFDVIKRNMLHGQCSLSARWCFFFLTNSHKYNYLSLSLSLSASLPRQLIAKIGVSSVCCHINYAKCDSLYTNEYTYVCFGLRVISIAACDIGERERVVYWDGLGSMPSPLTLRIYQMLYLHRIYDKRWLVICHRIGWFSADNNSAQFHFNVYLVTQWDRVRASSFGPYSSASCTDLHWQHTNTHTGGEREGDTRLKNTHQASTPTILQLSNIVHRLWNLQLPAFVAVYC